MKKVISLFISIIVFSLIFVGCSCTQTQTAIRAVWWWNDELNLNTQETYLNFAKENGINQIYYCTNKFNEETANFIKSANNLGIEVFWLDGNYKWLHSAEQEQKLHNKLNNYATFNKNYPSTQFAGVHLDVEPHQSKNSNSVLNETNLPINLDFETELGRQTLITNLINLVIKLDITYPDINFAYDIPFWLNDQIEINGITKPAYEHIIEHADGIVVMSYRDTATEIFNVAKEELEFANSISKTITLSVECGNSGNTISFYEEGKQVLNQELSTLEKLVPPFTGMCIHHIESWFKLQD